MDIQHMLGKVMAFTTAIGVAYTQTLSNDYATGKALAETGVHHCDNRSIDRGG